MNTQPIANAMPWQVQAAEALNCFWNAAIGAERNGTPPAAAIAQGFEAVATRLTEIAMSDLDQFCLSIARVFTKESEPQRRARLQVAIRTAICVADTDLTPAGYELVDDMTMSMLRERAELPLRIESDEVWHWQGDGYDYPESLNCPVIMTADTLRELLQRRPLAWQADEAAILRRAGAVLQNWEDDPNVTGYMGDFGDAVAILEVLAQHARPAVDLQQFRPFVLRERREIVERIAKYDLICRTAAPAEAAQARLAEVDAALAVIDGAAPATKPADPEVRRIRIPARNNLDPITVFVEDLGQGRGRMAICCYASAWNAYWGAMGTDSTMEFVASCNADYIGNSMTSGTILSSKKREQAYADRIAAEVVAEVKSILAGEVRHD